MSSFFADHCVQPSAVDIIPETTYWRTGGFTLHSTEQDTDTTFVGIVRSRARGIHARVSVDVTPREPWQVTRFDIHDLPSPPGTAVERETEAAALSHLSQRLTDATAADQFSGVMLVHRRGLPVFGQAHGLADREHGIGNTMDTRFSIASMGKMFTGVAVLQLVQAGEIELEATLDDYVPDYPNRDLASAVTVHHLLTHTGGAGDFFGPELPRIWHELDTVDAYVRHFGHLGPEFEPGSRWVYSNYGFVLLGLLIEQVSGQGYAEYIADHVFGPASMRDTTFEPERNVPGHATAYSRTSVALPWQPVTDRHDYPGSPAGGAYSTAGDMARFAAALLDNRLLDAEHTELVTTGKVTARGGAYAYGFVDVTENGTRWFGHTGGNNGINSELRIYPESGYVLVGLSNLDPPAAAMVMRYAGDRLPAR
ncbi:serine hydrolase domain-containing protein [Jiangella asiatica]|uniref:serine hydrolase domain-containing protein n=1 Tax=Jiangella asiatica TaxID=2530372 RepID=UPI0013A5BF77|nr:serine hydrolase domain-containing protein [Jiangella asiatica]